MLAGGRSGPNRPPANRYGWAWVAAVVVGYDTWAAASGTETLSAQFRAASLRHPAVIGAATGYLVLHLWGCWPRSVDPFCLFCRAVAACSSQR